MTQLTMTSNIEWKTILKSIFEAPLDVAHVLLIII